MNADRYCDECEVAWEGNTRCWICGQVGDVWFATIV